MPKINQEKTQQLQEQQSLSVESLFSKTKKDTSASIKNILTQHLGNPNNAKYYETLKILKYARNNKHIASKLFTKNMIKAIEEFSELGMSNKTIDDIISIVYDKKCNYYNTEAKIKALWHIRVDSFDWSNETNLEKQMKSWIWWTCADLSAYIYNKFIDKKIISHIQKETKQETVLWMCGGNCDVYFVWENNHQFLFLDIWDKRYVIDPSFGVLANINDVSYEDDSLGMDTELFGNKHAWYLDEKIQTAKTWKISLNKWSKRIECEFEWIPFWFLSGTDIFLGLGFAKTDYGKIIPLMAWTTADTNYWVYFIKDNELRYICKDEGDIFWHRNKDIPQDIQQKLKNILMGLMKYGKDEEYDDDIDDKEKENATIMPIRSGIVRFYNRIKWLWTILDDETYKYINIEWWFDIHENQPVKYIEVNDKAILTTAGTIKTVDKKNKKITIISDQNKEETTVNNNLSFNAWDKVDFLTDKHGELIAIQKHIL